MSQPFHSAIDRILPFEDWMDEGKCRGEDTLVFFPGDGSHLNSQAAKEICNFCPVQLQCLEYALTYRRDDGVWGGTTGRERRRIVRARRSRLRLALDPDPLPRSAHG